MHILEMPSFFPPLGGLFCLDQAKALKELGHEVRILSNVQLGVTVGLKDFVTLPFGRFEEERGGVTVFQSFQRGLPKSVRYNAMRWVKTVGGMFDDYVARYGQPDILHAHCAKWGGYAAMLIGQKYHIPYVITEHMPFYNLREELGEPPTTAWQVPLLRQAYHRADMVVTVAEELINDMVCYFGSDYRWTFISNIIDTRFFCHKPRLPREGRPFRFCCPAIYTQRKGYDVLLAAFDQMENQKAELHVAGLNTDSSQFAQMVGRLSSADRVKTHGNIDREGIRQLLYDSDALVLATRGEVQPLVLLEAMSTGLPVISTECVPTNERIEGGCTIVPVDDVQALAKAMDRQTTAPAAADGGMRLSQAVQRLASKEVVGRQLEEVLRNAIARYASGQQ